MFIFCNIIAVTLTVAEPPPTRHDVSRKWGRGEAPAQGALTYLTYWTGWISLSTLSSPSTLGYHQRPLPPLILEGELLAGLALVADGGV